MIRDEASRALTLTALLVFAGGAAWGEVSERNAATPPAERTARYRSVEIPPGMRVPTVRLSVVQDSLSGWNLFAEVSDFRFAPDAAGRVLRPGEGHAFVYVDGEEIARVYGPAYHIERLEPGLHEIEFTLNANDHSFYAWHGTEIADRVSIEVPYPPLDARRRILYKSPTAIPAGEPRPSVVLEVSSDPASGWNVMADVSGFDFAPESVGGENAPAQGHANLFVDGRKVARLYGRSYHLPDLEPGIHRIQVSLVGNDHAPYVHRGEEIAATARIEVPAHVMTGSSAIDVDSAIAPANAEHPGH